MWFQNTRARDRREGRNGTTKMQSKSPIILSHKHYPNTAFSTSTITENNLSIEKNANSGLCSDVIRVLVSDPENNKSPAAEINQESRVTLFNSMKNTTAQIANIASTNLPSQLPIVMSGNLVPHASLPSFPTPPASCSTDSIKHSSPSMSPQPASNGIQQVDNNSIESSNPSEKLIVAKTNNDESGFVLEEHHEDDSRQTETPLDLSTKGSSAPSPCNSPPPLVINSEAEEDLESDGSDIDDDDDENDEDVTVTGPGDNDNGKQRSGIAPPFQLSPSLRPPIDIDALAKTHFENMVQAQLVRLEPSKEVILPHPGGENDASGDATDIILPNGTSQNESMDVHIRTVKSSGDGTSQRPTYYCDLCDKTFTKKSSITRHKYEHSGKKSYYLPTAMI